MNRRKWLIAAGILVAAALVVIGVTSAYLTDVEILDNVITIGRVKLSLDEGEVFDVPPDPDNPVVVPVVPGSRVEKAPSLTNTGNKDEYVFLKISVPKKNVTLLYEDNVYDTQDPPQLTELRKGTVRKPQALQELFRLIAHDTVTVNNVDTPISTAAVPPESPPTVPDGSYDVDIGYHNPGGAGDADGWELLYSVYPETGHESEDDVYVFGYNRRLAPGESTKTLFDEAQLKSFIDAEATGAVDVGVFCYGIQADNLKGVTLGDPPLTRAELQSVWAIVQNKLDQ